MPQETSQQHASLRRPLRDTKAINETGSPVRHNVYAKDSSASRRRIVRAVTFLLALSTLMFSLVLLRPVGASSESAPQEAISQDTAVAEAEATAAGSGCVTPQFALAGPGTAAGDGPVSAAAADFDGDNRADLAVANLLSNKVTIRFGGGSGSFMPWISETAANEPVFVAAADFDHNDRKDLIVVNRASDDVFILLGNGTTPIPSPPIAVGDSPRAAVVANFNDDAELDLAVANEGSDNVSIRLGDGAGGFTNGADVLAGIDPVFLATGDFNRDGALDLAIVNQGSDNVSIRLGDGLGGFTNAANVAVGDSPQAVTTGDFNRDGKLDLAVVNQGPDTFSIRLGDGAGGFTGAGGASVGTDPTSIVAGDFNSDGKLDLAVANSGSNNLTVRLGNGSGLFPDANAVTIGASNFPSSVAVADFNNDGKLDLAAANRNSDNVMVWRNTCDLTPCGGVRFRQPAGSPLITGNFPFANAVADFNRDGKPDMAVIHQFATHVAIRLGNGVGGFTSAPNVPIGSKALDVATGDFNSDGKPDLAVVNTDDDHDTDSVSILLGDGAGGFTAGPELVANSIAASVVVADFNRDGKEDLAVANAGSRTVSMLLGDGAGGFTKVADVPVGIDPFSLTTADFNLDGNPDLAVANAADDTVSILLGDGTGGFTSAPSLTTGDNPVHITVGDFNRDSSPDLAVANLYSLSVSIRVGHGDGTFSTRPDVPAGTNPSFIGLGDFNMDGKQDLAVSNFFTNRVVIRLGADFPDLFTAAPDLTVGQDPAYVAVADFNRDGKPDLAVSNSASDNVSIHLNGCSPPAELAITQTASGPRFLAGQTVSYTVQVTNNGPYAVTGVAGDPGAVVTDVLPGPLTFVSAPNCGYASGTRTVTCNITTIGVGVTVTRTITARVNAAGVINNKTVVKGTGRDSVSTNNSATTTVTGVSLKSVTLSPTTIAGGCGSATGTVTLTSAAPAGGALVKLVSNNAAVVVPASVTIAAGQTTATFMATTNIVNANKAVGVTAFLPNTNPVVSKTANLVLTPILTSLTLSPNPVQGGTPVTGTLMLACAAPQNITFTLSSNNAAATPDVSSVTINAGQSSKQFTITTQTVTAQKTAVIKATSAGGTKQTNLIIQP